MESNDESQTRCFEEWMKLQEQDLSELLEALNGDHSNDENTNSLLKNLVEKSLQHFRDYIKQRNDLASSHVSPYFAPSWCSSLEGSMLWIGGCRPSMFIRLLYAKIGKDVESGLEDYIQQNGMRRVLEGNLGDVSAGQMSLINKLQKEIIEGEDKLSAKLTGLQEDMADQPIALIANDANSHREENGVADEALDNHAKSTLKLLKEADELRIRTLEKLVVNILSPLQAVEFLAASKKLHLCIREWGRRRDNCRGRNSDKS